MYRKFLDAVIVLLPLPIVIAWAFANFLYLNRLEFLLYDVIAKYYILYSLVFVLAFSAVLLVFPNRRRQIAIISYLITAGLFMLPGLIEFIGIAIQQRYLIGAVLIFSVIFGLLLSRMMAEDLYIRNFSIFFFLLTMIPSGQLAFHNFTDYQKSSLSDSTIMDKAVRRPNVYFIILDGYLRADQLKTVMGYDNSSFLHSLEKMGFFVAERASSNYTNTIFSISSTFRMSYATDYSKYSKGIFNSATYQNFRNLGYRLVYMPSHRGRMRCIEDIQCVSNEINAKDEYLSQLEHSLLNLLPLLTHYLYRLVPELAVHALNEVSTLQQYLDKPTAAQPIFLYAHIMVNLPKDADCNKPKLGAKVEPKKAYVQSLRCSNPIVRKTVMDLVKNDPDAIIILQADHGPTFVSRMAKSENFFTTLNRKNWLKDFFKQRFSILNAWRLPTACKKWLSHDLSSINTFRLVFGCITETEPKFLSNRNYWTELPHGNRTNQTHLVRKGERWFLPTIE